MTIGIDIRTLMDARPSGVSEYTLNLTKEILRLDGKNQYRLFYNCFGDRDIPKFQGANVELTKYDYPNKILNYLLFKIFNRPKIDLELETDVFFMPHINFIGLGGFGKKIIAVHDLSFLRQPEFFSARKNFWHRAINVKKLLQKFDIVVGVSENTKRDVVELCGVDEKKVKVIYSGIGEEYRKMANDECQMANNIKNKYNLPEKFILYLGTIEPRKNVDGIIRAYNELRSAHNGLSDYKLVLAGERGWKSAGIYQEWEKSQFKNDIIFLGYVGSADKVYIYNLAGVFIYPSFYEGFGFPPLEAMACGTPVITSYAASLPEVAGEAALLVNPYDISELAAALKNVLVDEKLKNRLISRGLEQAKKFRWTDAAKQYLEIFYG